MRELRWAIRMLGRRKGISAAVIVTLALGIGVTTAMFSVVQRVILQALPYPQPRQLVLMLENMARAPKMNVAWPDYLDWRSETHSFSALAAFAWQGTSYQRLPNGTAAPVSSVAVSASLFPLLHVHFVLGRGFTPAEDQAGAAPVAVISERFWREDLGSDPRVIGENFGSPQQPVHVVGVLAETSGDMPWSADVYAPIALNASDPSWASRGNHPGIEVLGRLKIGVTPEEAKADLGVVMARLAAAYPVSNKGETAFLQPLDMYLNGSYRAELWLLLGAVGLVLLLACANLAHLLLAQASGRQREFAIRQAVGASRADLIRQSAAETAVLAVLGGAAGVLLAWWAIPLLVHWAPYPVPRLEQAQLNTAVVGFAALAALVAAPLMGLLPALEAARAQVNERMRVSGHGRLRAGLLVAEVAIAVVVVAGAGLLARSLQRVLEVSPGFNLRGLIILPVSHEPKGAAAYFETTLDHVRALPGVASASFIMTPPLHGFQWTTPYRVSGQAAPPPAERPWSVLNMAWPGYFTTIGARLEAGSSFTEADGAKAPLVAVVNQAMAERMGGNVIGKRLYIQDDNQWREVVGVVGNIRQISLTAPAHPEIFVPWAQFPQDSFGSLVVRASGNPDGVMRELSAAVGTLEPPELMTAALGNTLVRRDFLTELMAGFGLLALLLATLGIYAITANRVAQQVREMGVRMALGASGGDLVRTVLGASLRFVALGLAIGLVGAYFAGRLWGAELYGVGAGDPAALGGTCALLLAVAVAACLRPAWRAARADPMAVLRTE